MSPFPGESIVLADGSSIPVLAQGYCVVQFKNGHTLGLQDVQFVPALNQPLLSIPLMIERGAKAEFSDLVFY